MALKVGDLYVSVTAAIGEALTSLTKLVDAVEKTAMEIKNATKDMGEIGAIVAAGIGAAVAAAAKSNPRLQAEVERLTELLYTLAADIGDLFAPVVKQLTDFVSRLVATFQVLSPQVKRAGADLSVWIAGAGLAIGAVGKLAGVVEALSGGMGLLLKGLGKLQKSTALAGLGAQMAAIALPLAAVAAAVAGLTLLAGAVYGAWTDSSTGLKDSVVDIVNSVTGMAKKLWALLTSIFEALFAIVESIAVKALDTFAWMVRNMAKLLAPLAKAAQMGNLHKAILAAQNITGEDLLKMAKEAGGVIADGVAAAGAKVEAAASAVWEAGKEGGRAVAYGFEKSVEGAKKIFNDTGLSALLDNLKSLSLPKLSLSDAEPVVRDVDGIDKELELIERVIASLNTRAADEARIEYERSVAAEERRINLQLEAQKLADAAAKAMKDARKTLVSGLTAAFGRIKDLVEAFQTGTEASGSAWGGLAAVVAQLLTESKGFLDLINMVSNIVQRVADGLGELLVPMQPLIGAIGYIVEVLMTALEPLLTYLGQVLGYLAPPLVIVGKLLEGLAPLLNALMPPLSLVQDALKAVFDVLRFVSIVILMVAQLIGTIWNAVVAAIQAVVRGLSKAVEWLGIDSLKKFAKSMDKMKVDTDAMGDSMRTLQDTTWESADAQARQTAELLKGTAALEKMNEALTNVPAAWKVALRRFQVQDAADGPGSPTQGGGGAGGDGGTGDPYSRMPQWYREFMELPEELRRRREDQSRDPYTGGKRAGEYIPKTSAPVQALKGPTYNLNINTLDPDEGVERAVRFVRRVDSMTKLGESGRRISKSSRYGG